jgi:hypothetical protein
VKAGDCRFLNPGCIPTSPGFGNWVREIRIGFKWAFNLNKPTMVHPTDPLRNRLNGYYQNYASLFGGYFPQVQKALINQLDTAGWQCFQAALQLDRLADEADPDALLPLLGAYRRSVSILSGLFSPESNFWTRWSSREAEMVRAVKTERSFTTKDEVGFDEFCRLAEAKSALANLALDALYELAPEKEKVEATYRSLLKSHSCFSAALQLYDDLVDVEEDFLANRFNWVLYTWSGKNGWPESQEQLNVARKKMYLQGHAHQIFMQILRQLDKSRQHIPGQGEWRRVVEQVSGEMDFYDKQASGYVQMAHSRLRTCRVAEPETIKPARDWSWNRGLGFLNSERIRNWPGLRHFMYLSDGEGFQGFSGVHSSDLFYRLLADDFLARRLESSADMQRYLEREIVYYLRQRRSHAENLWSYFPSMPFLSADIDDLSQVMRFFIGMRRHDLIDRYCLNKLARHAVSGLDENGVMLTWITSGSELEGARRQRDLNYRLWGVGPDPEVVANMYDVLLDYKPSLLEPLRVASVVYLKNAQLSSGAWGSRWYVGLPYGTYRVGRYLYRIGELRGRTRQLWYEYLYQGRNPDGGYGLRPGATSDPLSTALLALCMRDTDHKQHPFYRGARDFLLRSQGEDGSWDSVPFVSPRPGQAFRSRVVTTVFALDALYG